MQKSEQTASGYSMEQNGTIRWGIPLWGTTRITKREAFCFKAARQALGVDTESDPRQRISEISEVQQASFDEVMTLVS